MRPDKQGGILIVLNGHETIASCQGPSLLHAELDRHRLAYAAARHGPWGQIDADGVLVTRGDDRQTPCRVAPAAARSSPDWTVAIIAALRTAGLANAWELHGPQDAIVPLLAAGHAAGLGMTAPLIGRITSEQLDWLSRRTGPA